MRSLDQEEREIQLEEAEASFAARMFGSAIEQYLAIFRRYPGWEYAEHSMMMAGLCHEREGRPRESIRCFRKAVAKFPRLEGFSDVTWYYLGRALARQGSSRRAARALERSLELASSWRSSGEFPVLEAREALHILRSKPDPGEMPPR